MFITGIIGYPLKTTLSPALHNITFKKMHLRGKYLPLRVPPPGLKRTISLVRKLKFSGINVTTPYKLKIIQYLDHLDPISEKIGAVNAVVVRNDRLLGYNTDAYGFKRSLRRNKIDLRGKKVLLIGAGGAARACAFVLKSSGSEAVYVANRTSEKARSIARIFNAEAVGFKKINNVARISDLVINATTGDLRPLILPLLRHGSIFYDLNYPIRSPQTNGVRTINGISMLIFQAMLSFYLWTKKMPRFTVMETALKVKGGL
jgi:shikimate dehydrogenase